MSEQTFDDQQETDEDFKNLRSKAKKSDQFERENSALKRELAFVKAGIDSDDPRMAYFVKGYDGELDASQIRQAAVDAGFIAATPPPADPAADQARAGQAAVVAAGSGTEPEFGLDAVAQQMQNAMNEGGLAALASVSQQYGVTFNSPEVH